MNVSVVFYVKYINVIFKYLSLLIYLKRGIETTWDNSLCKPLCWSTLLGTVLYAITTCQLNVEVKPKEKLIDYHSGETQEIAKSSDRIRITKGLNLRYEITTRGICQGAETQLHSDLRRFARDPPTRDVSVCVGYPWHHVPNHSRRTYNRV